MHEGEIVVEVYAGETGEGAFAVIRRCSCCLKQAACPRSHRDSVAAAKRRVTLSPSRYGQQCHVTDRRVYNESAISPFVQRWQPAGRVRECLWSTLWEGVVLTITLALHTLLDRPDATSEHRCSDVALCEDARRTSKNRRRCATSTPRQLVKFSFSRRRHDSMIA